jgi:hypothetical protein
MHFRYQKNRLCRKVACHVFSQKNLTHGFAFCELRMCNAARFAWFPGDILPVCYLYLQRSTYIRLSVDDLRKFFWLRQPPRFFNLPACVDVAGP